MTLVGLFKKFALPNGISGYYKKVLRIGREIFATSLCCRLYEEKIGRVSTLEASIEKYEQRNTVQGTVVSKNVYATFFEKIYPCYRNSATSYTLLVERVNSQILMLYYKQVLTRPSGEFSGLK